MSDWQLLLLDDVDRALHPKAQVDLVTLLKNALKQGKGRQILCTSHAPMVVSSCQPEEVIELDFDQEGYPAVQIH